MRLFFPSASSLLTDRLAHGEGLIAWNMLRGLAARGHELVVCCRRAELDAEPGFEVIELGRRSRFESLDPLAYARTVRRIGRTQGADAWHWLFPQEPGELQLVPPAGAPLVLGPWPERWPERLPRNRPGDAVRLALTPFSAYRTRRALRRGRVLAATPAAAAAIGTASIVPFGVDADVFTAAPPPAGAPVLFVGRLDRRKGIRELVEAVARVPEARLVVAGEGPERPWVEARVRALALGDRVELRGAVPAREVPALLRRAALLCAPSHGEPYGMSVLEAMAAGRAVVATDAGGPRFLVGDGGGALVPVGDVEALARALRSLLRDPPRLARIGMQNRERVERDLSLERMLDRLESVYAEAAA